MNLQAAGGQSAEERNEIWRARSDHRQPVINADGGGVEKLDLKSGGLLQSHVDDSPCGDVERVHGSGAVLRCRDH